MKKIAVVEDNPDNRLLLQALLGDSYEVEEYETGADALQGIARDVPDLVLLDISLPGLDGTQVLKQIRETEGLRDLPVIALTAHAMSDDRQKALEAGCNDYDTKPVELPRLLGKIEALLGGGDGSH